MKITSNGPYPGYYSQDLTLDSTNNKVVLVHSPKGERGFVRGLTKFMVTDDLVVTPLSSMSCFTHLNKLKVPPTYIKEQVINIGMEEVMI